MSARVLLATSNAHKVREIAAILAPFGIEVEAPDLVLLRGMPEETGATFAENARLKASVIAAVARRPALADDSGLVVLALGGDPGVHSARYAGDDATDADNNAKLLSELAKRGLVDPPAAFVCCAVLVAPGGRVLAESEGRVEGVLRAPPRGSNGFGYDPLFHYVGHSHPPPGVRFAELPASAKAAISHRGLAFRSLGAKIRALLAQNPDALDA